MKSPYELLEVSENAMDAEIKQAYLKKVKDNPPDREQVLFQQIQQAYQSIKDAKSRLSYALFHVQPADFDALLNRAFHSGEPVPPLEPDVFSKLLNASVDEKMLVNAIPNKHS